MLLRELGTRARRTARNGRSLSRCSSTYSASPGRLLWPLQDQGALFSFFLLNFLSRLSARLWLELLGISFRSISTPSSCMERVGSQPLTTKFTLFWFPTWMQTRMEKFPSKSFMTSKLLIFWEGSLMAWTQTTMELWTSLRQLSPVFFDLLSSEVSQRSSLTLPMSTMTTYFPWKTSHH